MSAFLGLSRSAAYFQKRMSKLCTQRLFKPKLQWCYYRANLTYYRTDARGNNLAPYLSSRMISFQVSATDHLKFNDREIKHLSAPDFIRSIPKRHLCNGRLCIENIQFLGQFEKLPDGGEA